MNLLVMGKSYCGKSELIKLLERDFDYTNVLHVGDVVRAKYSWAPTLLETNELINIIDDFIHINVLPWIIDNPAKTVEQLEAVIKYLQSKNILFKVLWVVDERTNIDFSSRGRSDDTNIFDKRAIWEENVADMLKLLTSEHIDIQEVVNTDEGFLFRIRSGDLPISRLAS